MGWSKTRGGRRGRQFCAVCGSQTVVVREDDAQAAVWLGRCFDCGAVQSDYAFLPALARLPADTAVRLSCPGAGCGHQFTFPARAFAATRHVGGNGPYTYPLLCRFALQARCPDCGDWWGSADFIRNNRGLLAEQEDARP